MKMSQHSPLIKKLALNSISVYGSDYPLTCLLPVSYGRELSAKDIGWETFFPNQRSMKTDKKKQTKSNKRKQTKEKRESYEIEGFPMTCFLPVSYGRELSAKDVGWEPFFPNQRSMKKTNKRKEKPRKQKNNKKIEQLFIACFLWKRIVCKRHWLGSFFSNQRSMKKNKQKKRKNRKTNKKKRKLRKR